MHFLAATGFLPVYLALASATPVVTEADVLATLDHGSPAVVAQSSALPVAQAALGAARMFDNPVLGIVREDPDGPTAQTEWLLSWQLPDTTRRREITAATKAVDAAAARVDHGWISLRSAVRADYARWAIASARRQLLSSEAARITAMVNRHRARAEKGEASGLEVHRLRLAEDALRARLVLTAAAERQAKADVGRWLPSLDPDAQPELPALPPASDPVSAGESAGEHPLVKATQAELDVAELKHQISKQFLSAPALTVGWQRQEGRSAEESGPIVGLSWTLPIFNRNQASRISARAQRDVARARVAITVAEIEARRSTAGARYAALVNGVDGSKAAHAANADMLGGAETSFRYGELTLTDLLDIQRAVTDAHRTWLDLYAAALAAHRDLESLTSSTPYLRPPKDAEP